MIAENPCPECNIAAADDALASEILALIRSMGFSACMLIRAERHGDVWAVGDADASFLPSGIWQHAKALLGNRAV
jgi:hypothetical protein